MKSEHWFWIGGWGIPPQWLKEQLDREIPAATHTVVPPTPEAITEFDSERFSAIGGYSFGAFLLLKNVHLFPLPALLLAPFFAYPAEANLGGRIKRAQILFLLRWLRRSPLAALADFYQRAKLPLPPPTELPYPLEDLTWGLTQLADESAPPRLPANWRGIVGAHDPLLDSHRLRELDPRLKIAANAAHDPARLIRWNEQRKNHMNRL